jgi:hypothetical protein
LDWEGDVRSETHALIVAWSIRTLITLRPTRWLQYVRACGKAGVRTFGQLAQLRAYKFTASFADAMLDETARMPVRKPMVIKSRAGVEAKPKTPAQIERLDRQLVLAAYWDALTAALADLDITPYEVFYLKAKQSALGVRPEELRWIHARAFSGILADMCQDKAISDDEAAALNSVALALRELGWAPGDEPTGGIALV